MAQASECSHRTISEWSALTADRDRLRAENEALKAAIREHRTGVLHGERGLEASDYDEALWRSVETDEQHVHHWTTTGRVDTGHQPPHREYECACGNRQWADDNGPGSHPTPEEGR